MQHAYGKRGQSSEWMEESVMKEARRFKKCWRCARIYYEHEGENIISYGKQLFQCNFCSHITSTIINPTPSLPTSLNTLLARRISSTATSFPVPHVEPLIRRIAKHEKYFPTRKLVRSIKAIVMEAPRNKYHAF